MLLFGPRRSNQSRLEGHMIYFTVTQFSSSLTDCTIWQACAHSGLAMDHKYMT
jgi:hypothetical protein